MTSTHPSPNRARRLLTVAAVCLLAVGVLDANSAAASAKKQACWEKVVQDWYVDGRIDGTYPPKCLAEATQHIPTDAKEYSSFADEAHRALLADERWQRQHRGRTPHYNFGGPGPSGGDYGPPGLHSGGGGGPSASAQGPIPWVIDSAGPADPTAVPVPLLVLGGLAIVLMLAGVASYFARRVQAHRLQP